MSGGAFEYDQYRINNIVEVIKHEIRSNNIKNEWGESYDFDDEIIAHFKDGIKYLEKAAIYAQRIDWLLSGDDGEDSFKRRLKDELSELE